MIKFCTCEHEYQDKTYGDHKRVHNITKKGELRCTVCEKVKSIRGDT